MARSQTPRTAFGAGTYGQDADALARDVKQWGDRLPFGSYGFQVANSVPTLLPAATTTTLAYDTQVQDRENWLQNQINPFSAFTVPESGSGVYVINLSHRMTGVVGGQAYYSYGPTTLTAPAGSSNTWLLGDFPFSPGEQFDVSLSFQGNGSTGAAAGISSVYLDVAAGTGGSGSGGSVGFGNWGLNGLNVVPFASTVGVAPDGNLSGVISSISSVVRLTVRMTAPALYAAQGQFMFAQVRRVSPTLGQVKSLIQINGIAVSNDDVSSGQYSETTTLEWLTEGDVISTAVYNASSVAVTLAADPNATATTPQSPLLSATRIALL